MKKDIVIHTFKEKKPCYGSACLVKMKTGALYILWFAGVDTWKEWYGFKSFKVDDDDLWVYADDLFLGDNYCKDQDIDNADRISKIESKICELDNKVDCLIRSIPAMDCKMYGDTVTCTFDFKI